jgi:hypothetical protein
MTPRALVLLACLATMACGPSPATSNRKATMPLPDHPSAIAEPKKVDAADGTSATASEGSLPGKHDPDDGQLATDSGASDSTELAVNPVRVWMEQLRGRFLHELHAHPAPASSSAVEARVHLTISAANHVTAWTLVKVSGVVAFDEAVIDAVGVVMKSAQPPPDPPPGLAGKTIVVLFLCAKDKCW